MHANIQESLNRGSQNTVPGAASLGHLLERQSTSSYSRPTEPELCPVASPPGESEAGKSHVWEDAFQVQESDPQSRLDIRMSQNLMPSDTPDKSESRGGDLRHEFPKWLHDRSKVKNDCTKSGTSHIAACRNMSWSTHYIWRSPPENLNWWIQGEAQHLSPGDVVAEDPLTTPWGAKS